MALKIKWNDDRIRGATTAILLISRDRLARGETEDLIRASLADYRSDTKSYKMNKASWPEARETVPLTHPAHVAYYRNLILALDGLVAKLERSKRMFNSLLELDNWLVASLKSFS